MKITIKILSEQTVSADDIKRLGLTGADIRQRLGLTGAETRQKLGLTDPNSGESDEERIAPPIVGSDDWKAAEKMMAPETGGVSQESERKIIKAIRNTMLDPAIVNMIRQALDRHLASLSPPGSASPAAAEKTLAGNRPRSI